MKFITGSVGVRLVIVGAIPFVWPINPDSIIMTQFIHFVPEGDGVAFTKAFVALSMACVPSSSLCIDLLPF